MKLIKKHIYIIFLRKFIRWRKISEGILFVKIYLFYGDAPSPAVVAVKPTRIYCEFVNWRVNDSHFVWNVTPTSVWSFICAISYGHLPVHGSYVECKFFSVKCHRASIWTESWPPWSLLPRLDIKEFAHIVLNAHATVILLLAHRARMSLVMKSNARKSLEKMSFNTYFREYVLKCRTLGAPSIVQPIIRSASFEMNLFLVTVLIRWARDMRLNALTPEPFHLISACFNAHHSAKSGWLIFFRSHRRTPRNWIRFG